MTVLGVRNHPFDGTRIMRIFGMLAVLAALTAGESAQATERLYACGDDQVREYACPVDGATETWRWTAAAAGDLPAAYRTTLLAISMTASRWRMARRSSSPPRPGVSCWSTGRTGKVRFRATAPMAHSADCCRRLCGGRAVDQQERGQAGIVRLSQSEHLLASLPLPSGHSAVWDARRQRLFALSHDLIQALSFDPKAAEPC